MSKRENTQKNYKQIFKFSGLGGADLHIFLIINVIINMYIENTQKTIYLIPFYNKCTSDLFFLRQKF